MATAPLITITYKKEAKVLTYERKLYADLGHFYLRGSPDAQADWTARRKWTTQRAGVDSLQLADAISQLYYDQPAPQDEREARGDREFGIAIQKARMKFGREISYDDVQLMNDVGYSLDELIAYLEQFDDASTKLPGLKIYSNAELAAQGFDVQDSDPEASKLQTGPEGAATGLAMEENEDGIPAHRTGRFDMPAVYHHLVSPLDNGDANSDPFVEARSAVTSAMITQALRENSPHTIPMSMPISDAAFWQKEAVAVCRLLLAKVTQRLHTVQVQLSILAQPPPSRARFRQRESRGSPYKSSPLASG